MIIDDDYGRGFMTLIAISRIWLFAPPFQTKNVTVPPYSHRRYIPLIADYDIDLYARFGATGLPSHDELILDRKRPDGCAGYRISQSNCMDTSVLD